MMMKMVKVDSITWKGVLVWLGVVLTILGIVIACETNDCKRDLEKWNNGHCHCGGTYVNTGVDKFDAYFQCSECAEIIEINKIIFQDGVDK